MSVAPFNSLHSAVKLVIWDLDDTFWNGRLSDGTMTPIREHIDMVRALVDRGIMCSICSKNDAAAAKAALEELGIWDLFVFPHIEMAPKGKMITRMVADMGLDDAHVLLLDNNRLTLKEAQHFNRNLMVVGGAQQLSALLDLPQMRGHDDNDHTTLKAFKRLEAGMATRDPLLCEIGSADLSAVTPLCSDNRIRFNAIHDDAAAIDQALAQAGMVVVSLFETTLARINAAGAQPIEQHLAALHSWYKRASTVRDIESPFFVLGAMKGTGDAVARDAFNAVSRSFCATTPNAIFIDQDLVPATAQNKTSLLAELINEHVLRCEDMRLAS